MELFEAIAKRHSYRGPFRDEPVPREHLRRIVEAGLLAPSGEHAQTTTFVVVDDPEKLRAIASMPHNKAMQQAKAYIACVVDKCPTSVYENMTFQAEDCAAATENILLAVTALGYATVWIDGWLRVQGHAETIGRLLNVPEDKVVRVILPIGIPAREVVSKVVKKPFEERAWFNQYGYQPR
ncbi:MAG: nitroreductase family protein [Candidatus Hydrogenedentes bacterium]|nr:nitroreductase family protein [Candidatus Hydrogenedentota bacterium]